MRLAGCCLERALVAKAAVDSRNSNSNCWSKMRPHFATLLIHYMFTSNTPPKYIGWIDFVWNKTLMIFFRTGSNPNLHGPTDFSDPQNKHDSAAREWVAWQRVDRNHRANRAHNLLEQNATALCNFANPLYIYFQQQSGNREPCRSVPTCIIVG